MPLLNLNEINDKKGIKIIDSSLESLNNLFNEEAYNSDEIFTIYGKSNIGKTYFIFQEAYYFATKGYNVLYIDTEGGGMEMMKNKSDNFKKRFGDIKNGNIFFKIDAKTAEDLARYFGYEVRIKLKQAKKKDAEGKLEVSLLKIYDTPEIEEDILKHKIDIVIIDSISAPTKIFGSSKNQNLPARDDYSSLIYRTITRLQPKYKVIFIITAHASFNPADPYHKRAEMRGGGTVHYFGKRKYMLLIILDL